MLAGFQFPLYVVVYFGGSPLFTVSRLKVKVTVLSMSVHLMVKWTFRKLLALALYIVWSVSRHVEFDFWEKKKSHRLWMRRVWGLWNHWNTLFGQKFFHTDDGVTGSIVVMQHSGCFVLGCIQRKTWILGEQ